MLQIMLVSPEGEEVEILATEEMRFAEGALAGAQALLNFVADDLALDDGYRIALRGEAAHLPFSQAAAAPPRDSYLPSTSFPR